MSTGNVSPYVIQVVHAVSGRVAEWAPGLKVEKDLVNELVDRIIAKKVGVGRTKAMVGQQVRDAINEMLYDLKSQV